MKKLHSSMLVLLAISRIWHTCEGSSNYAVLLKQTTVSAPLKKEGEEGRDMTLQTRTQQFTDKQVEASEVTDPTGCGFQYMKYGHQNAYWTVQSICI